MNFLCGVFIAKNLTRIHSAMNGARIKALESSIPEEREAAQSVVSYYFLGLVTIVFAIYFWKYLLIILMFYIIYKLIKSVYFQKGA